jgi:hypothetical protein
MIYAQRGEKFWRSRNLVDGQWWIVNGLYAQIHTRESTIYYPRFTTSFPTVTPLSRTLRSAKQQWQYK